MPKDEVDPKTGKERPEPPPEKGMIQLLKESLDELLTRVKAVEDKTERAKENQKKSADLWASLFGPEPKEGE